MVALSEDRAGDLGRFYSGEAKAEYRGIEGRCRPDLFDLIAGIQKRRFHKRRTRTRRWAARAPGQRR